jgi:hypothetical protein
MTVPVLPILDQQVAAIEHVLPGAHIPSVARGQIPSSIHAEVRALDESDPQPAA